MLLSRIKEIRDSRIIDVDFKESEHPRDEDGKFSLIGIKVKEQKSNLFTEGYKTEKAQKSIARIFDGVPGDITPDVFGKKNDFAINLNNEHIEFSMEVTGKKNHIHLGLIKIPANQEGKGIGKKILHNMIDFAKREEIGEIHLSANLNVGKYAWAKLGFDFVDPDEKKEMIDNLHSYCLKNKISVESIDKLNTANDIANFQINGDPVGKSFMLSDDCKPWEGRLKI